MAAAFLDCLTAFIALLIIASVDCDYEESCESVISYLVLFGVYLTWHGWISVTVASRAKLIQPLLNPVSSGAITL